jgi:HEAT repeat protein
MPFFAASRWSVFFRGFSWCFVVSAIFLLSALSVAAQADLNSLREKIERGDTEAKRTALFDIRNLRSPEASRVALSALQDKDEIVRATAAGSVIFLPKNEAAQALLPLLADKSEMVRREAAYALGAVGDPSAVTALVNLLQKDKIIEVRGASAVALGRIGDIAAVEALVKLLRTSPNDDNEFLRRSAARSIGQIAGLTQDNAVFKTAVPPLIKALQNPKEADDTRREAAYALGAIGDASAIPALQRGTTSPDPYLAKAANEALLKIRDRP